MIPKEALGPLSVVSVYFVCAMGAVISLNDSSYVFLIFIAYLAIGLGFGVALRPDKGGLLLFDGMLFLAPVVLSALWSVSLGIYEATSLQYLVLYLSYAALVMLAGVASYADLKVLARGYVFICLFLVVVGVIAIFRIGVFTPFQILNLHDSSLSKNVFCAMLLAAVGFAATPDFFDRPAVRNLLLIILIFAILATESRAGLLALSVVVFFWKRSLAHYVFVIFGFILASGLLIFFDYYFGGSISGRLNRLFLLAQDFLSGNLNDDGNLDYRRVTLLLAGWRGFLDQPLLGWGPGQDAVAISNMVNRIELASTATRQHILSLSQGAHNQYLKNLIEYGVLSFLWVFLYIGIARRIASRPKLFASFAGLLAFAATNSVLTGLSVFPVFLMYLALSHKQEVRS